MVLKQARPRNRELWRAARLSPLSTAGDDLDESRKTRLNPANARAGRFRRRYWEATQDLPGMAVKIGEIPGIAAVIGLSRGLEEFRTLDTSKSGTASTSPAELQFQASVMPRNACGRGFADSATSSHGQSCQGQNKLSCCPLPFGFTK